MVSPNGAKLEEGWCEMATAKPKVKRMMFGGSARAAAGAAKAMASRAAPTARPTATMTGMLNQMKTAAPSTNTRGVLGAMAPRGMMKKGGAVKKKATKK